MTKNVNSGTSVSFDTPDINNASGAGIRLIQDNEGVAEFDQVLLRCYPPNPPILFATTGSLVVIGEDKEDIKSSVAFTGSTTAAMPVYGADNVTFAPEGQVYNLEGEPINPKIHYNAAAARLESSTPCYGVVLVSYTSKFSRISFRFAGGPCPIDLVNASIDPTSPVGFDGVYKPSMVVAANPTFGANAALNLSPPQCNKGTDSAGFIVANSHEQPTLLIELDDDEPSRLKGKVADELAAETGVRVYYGDEGASEVGVTSGIIERKKQGLHRTVREYVQFSGKGSSKLKYPPVNRPAIITESKFLDASGREVSGQVAIGGDIVTLAEWGDDGAARIIGDRTVLSGEIVYVDAYKLAAPKIWGTVLVEYTTRYDLFTHRPKFDKEAKAFANAFVLASSGDVTASASISGPKLGGDWK